MNGKVSSHTTRAANNGRSTDDFQSFFLLSDKKKFVRKLCPRKNSSLVSCVMTSPVEFLPEKWHAILLELLPAKATTFQLKKDH